jgi:hypothetical protein
MACPAVAAKTVAIAGAAVIDPEAVADNSPVICFITRADTGTAERETKRFERDEGFETFGIFLNRFSPFSFVSSISTSPSQSFQSVDEEQSLRSGFAVIEWIQSEIKSEVLHFDNIFDT